ncbi:MAG: CoA-acylating methylmalonate-semialdehyde dehydrogenase [Thaumarchaeota archaeon]|nr:CoA-acylating methylmalonate-semialdehyde dehydrogenase [Nitrososphaerota archaeon]
MLKNSQTLKLLVNGEWKDSKSGEFHPAYNPSTGEVIANIPYVSKEEVRIAVNAAQQAFPKWGNLPIMERVKYLFKMKQAFDNHSEDLARINSENHGKTIVESRGDVRRAMDNIESAISVAYTLAKGETLDQIANDIDESMVKEPLGVFGIICPFNFPLMIPFWFIPYAIVLGDTLVVKPSEITPVPMDLATKIIQEEVKLPPGVLNIIHGGREASEALISHEDVQGIAFVGSTPVAKQVYRLAGEHGKRALVNGGAKNPIVVMPDADLEMSIPAVVSSFFGNAGQRCLAGANLVTVGEIHDKVLSKFKTASSKLNIGNALNEQTEMGPVVSKNAKQRILGNIEQGMDEGAKPVLDGRSVTISEFPEGYYLGPTIFDDVSPDMKLAKQEIFGPVASTIHEDSLDAAIEFINGNTKFGNMASIFTTSGKAAREFRRRVNAGNIGINIGVASPAGNFPFGGRRESFYGILHAQIDTVEFFTDKKVIISRW